ncbi:MAG: asparaginase domain-containing protein [Pseudomonadota bacterium]
MSDSVLIVTTGGTIDKVYFDAKSEFEVGDSVVGRLLEQAHVRQPFEIVSLMRKDSLEITDADRTLIAETIAGRPETRVVVTHGTDTMTATAAVLGGLEGRTIVLTGALAPARFAESDAVFNVGMAFGAVQSLAGGVYICMNGQVFRAGEVVKDRSRNAFVPTTGQKPEC